MTKTYEEICVELDTANKELEDLRMRCLDQDCALKVANAAYNELYKRRDSFKNMAERTLERAKKAEQKLTLLLDENVKLRLVSDQNDKTIAQVKSERDKLAETVKEALDHLREVPDFKLPGGAEEALDVLEKALSKET